MEDREVTIVEVLDFREEKAEIQRAMRNGCQEAIVVSLGMNIPGPVKSGSSISHAFQEGKRKLQQAILKENGTIVQECVLENKAGYAAIYQVHGMERYSLKKMAVRLEETHPLGRLFDVDVMKANMEPISRTEVGAVPRTCLLCAGDAKACGRNRTHTVQELQDKVASILHNWEETA